MRSLRDLEYINPEIQRVNYPKATVVWADIPNFAGIYQINNFRQVRELTTVNEGAVKIPTDVIVPTEWSKDGVETVVLKIQSIEKGSVADDYGEVYHVDDLMTVFEGKRPIDINCSSCLTQQIA